MKKIYLLILFLLVGCGPQPLTWQEDIDQALLEINRDEVVARHNFRVYKIEITPVNLTDQFNLTDQPLEPFNTSLYLIDTNGIEYIYMLTKDTYSLARQETTFNTEPETTLTPVNLLDYLGQTPTEIYTEAQAVAQAKWGAINNTIIEVRMAIKPSHELPALVREQTKVAWEVTMRNIDVQENLTMWLDPQTGTILHQE